MERLNRKPKTPLERAAARWLRGANSTYRDLEYGGCQSGTVGKLVYYRDTIPFFKRHRAEINAMLGELAQDTGEDFRSLFSGWDSDDPLALDTNNQNLLAWYGFEEAARRLMEETDTDAE